MSDCINTENLLIRAMNPIDRAALVPHLVRVHLLREEAIATAGRRQDFVDFIEAGFVTLGTANAGRRTEIGIIGREGMSGLSLVLGSYSMPLDAAAQTTGGTALRIQADHLATALAQSHTLRTLLAQFAQTFMMQAAFTAVANVRCDLGARIARWLIMCHDRLDGDVIPMTHELLAKMVGAQRSSVTDAVFSLEMSGAISATRGRIYIRSRAILLDLVNEAYGQPEEEYGRLITPFAKQQRDLCVKTV